MFLIVFSSEAEQIELVRRDRIPPRVLGVSATAVGRKD